MLVGVKDGKAVAARGNPDHPVDRGKLCPKGLSEHHILDGPGRARTPLLRKHGKLEPVSWTKRSRRWWSVLRMFRHGMAWARLASVGTGQLLTEEYYTLGKLVRLGFYTPNNDGNTTLCMASAVSGYKLSFGSAGPPGSYADMESTDVVLLIGSNIADNHPILCTRVGEGPGKRPGRTLIVEDPRVTKTAMMADIHLVIKPRADLALINGIAHVPIRDGLTDGEYIAQHTTNYEAFADYVAGFKPEHVAEVTGLPKEKIEKVAHLYGKTRAVYRVDDGGKPLDAGCRYRGSNQQPRPFSPPFTSATST